MMDDLISRQAAIDALDCINGTEEVLRSLPSAQPEIIRCRNCKYYREYGYANGKPKFIPRCTFNAIYVNADDFCSKAERRTDG